MSWDESWMAPSSIGPRLASLPGRFVKSLFGLVIGWVQTRRFRWLLAGIPALILAGLIAVLAIDSRGGVSMDVANHYLARTSSALAKDEPDKAEFYLNRLESLGYRNDRTLSSRAMISTQRRLPEDTEDVYREMLNNSDRSGDAQAHSQLGQFALSRSTSLRSPDFQAAMGHFREAISLNPRDLGAHEMLARAELLGGHHEEACKHLELVAASRPALYLDLARIYERTANPTMMTFAASKAEKILEKIAREGLTPSATTETDPTSDHTATLVAAGGQPDSGDQAAAANKALRVRAYLDWSETLVMQGKLKEAVAALTAGEEQLKTPELRSRLTSVYVRQINEMPLTDAGWKQRWELLQLCLHYDPQSPKALIALAHMAVRAPIEVATPARQAIDPLIEAGTVPSPVYFLLGTHAVQQKDWVLAERLLQTAVEKEPRSDIAWNNLAYLHMKKEPVCNLDEAEKCIDQAIQLNPKPLTYHETRGQLMRKRERWTEAMRELELALVNMTASGEIHASLADVYDHLGDQDLADLHRSRASGLGGSEYLPPVFFDSPK